VYRSSSEHDSMDHNQGFIIPPWGTGDEYFNPDWNLLPVSYHDFPINPADYTVDSNTPEASSSSDSRSDSRSDTPLETNQNPTSKRRQRSESSQRDALVRPRKTRKLKAPQETAKVRKKGACLMCKRKRKEVSFVCELLISSPTSKLM
jgi:hypothetical protein